MSKPSLREAPLEFHTSLHEGDVERGADTLKLLPYAEAMRDFIQQCDTPMSIGIQGDWGIGKTSLMNMLRGKERSAQSGLLDSTKCLIVNFETWPYSQFNDGNDLLIACMHALTRKLFACLGEVDDLNTEAIEAVAVAASRKLKDAGNYVRSGMRHEGSHTEGEDIPAMMLSFREQFETLVEHWAHGDNRRRIVIFVDDLDRVPPTEALLLLESFKFFLDVPGCVFVLAVDYDVVQQGMAEKLGKDVQRTSGKALYDKIIQVPFAMPATSFNLEKYISGLLRQSAFPFAKELSEDPESLKYFLNITLCTVGRNPRNIKRVINCSSLLELVRERQKGSISVLDAKILYGLICMQIAWPELFAHFAGDPSVDTVTSLQNWDFLEQLPEARRLFDRTDDIERVKINVGTFFDTLFGLVDENGDGQVDSKELAPVLDVMLLANMTTVDTRERPRDWFISKVRRNNVNEDPLIETFLTKVFLKSIWYLGSECRYRKSGSRFVTIVHKGKQVGSLVTLPSQPFVFRLALAPEIVKSGLKAYWKSKHSVNTEAITFTRSVFGKESSMTGFGDTVVDFSKMTNMPSSDAVSLLNALFRIVTHDELPEWELEMSEGKKKKK